MLLSLSVALLFLLECSTRFRVVCSLLPFFRRLIPFERLLLLAFESGFSEALVPFEWVGLVSESASSALQAVCAFV